MAALWDTGLGRLSYQVLQEYFVVTTRKLEPPRSDEGGTWARLPPRGPSSTGTGDDPLTPLPKPQNTVFEDPSPVLRHPDRGGPHLLDETRRRRLPPEVSEQLDLLGPPAI